MTFVTHFIAHRRRLESEGVSQSPDEVRVIARNECSAAGQSLAEAFAEDEVAWYALNTDDSVTWSEQRKWSLHLQIMRSLTEAHCLRGLVTTLGEDYACVGLWLVLPDFALGAPRLRIFKLMAQQVTTWEGNCQRQICLKGHSDIFTAYGRFTHHSAVWTLAFAMQANARGTLQTVQGIFSTSTYDEGGCAGFSRPRRILPRLFGNKKT